MTARSEARPGNADEHHGDAVLLATVRGQVSAAPPAGRHPLLIALAAASVLAAAQGACAPVRCPDGGLCAPNVNDARDEAGPGDAGDAGGTDGSADGSPDDSPDDSADGSPDGSADGSTSDGSDGAAGDGATAPGHGDGDGAAPARVVQPGDVSILIPPTSPATPGVITLEDAGSHGVLLPASLYARIVPFVAPAPGTSNPIEREAFQVVAARIDPCFPDITALQTDPATCIAQLRLVAQPVRLGFPPSPTPPPPGEQRFGATDDAIHLLYDLPADAFTELVDEILAWSGLEQSLNIAGTGAEVWVHPRLAADGADGAARTALRTLLLRHAGVDRLSQYTFMRAEGVHAWDFGGFVVEDGEPAALAVHGTEANLQRLGASARIITVEPATSHSTSLAALFGARSTSTAPLTLGSPEAQRAALQAALDLENPTRTHPEAADCASCHAAFPLRQRAELLGASMDGLDPFTSSLALGGAVSATERLNNPPGCPGGAGEGCLFVENRLRIFGWLGQDPVVSQRAVNESAAVAEALAQRLNR